MNEEQRFAKAFAEVLEKDPSRAPGPTAINRAMGKTTGKLNTLNGRLSKQRRKLLRAAGFGYNETHGRWMK